MFVEEVVEPAVVEPVETPAVGKSYGGGFDKLNHQGRQYLKIDFPELILLYIFEKVYIMIFR